MTDLSGYLSLTLPHADEWRGTGYEIDFNGPAVTIRLPGKVNVNLRVDYAGDLMKLRAVISAAITALGYGEDLPQFDDVQRVVAKLNEHAAACAARTHYVNADDRAMWRGSSQTYLDAARIVTQDLVGAALVQSLNEEPEPAAVTELLKCECHE